MARKVRPWQRDRDVLREVARSPMTTRQITSLHGFPSAKKAAERLCALRHAGFLKQIPHVQPAKQGKPELVSFIGAMPPVRTLVHTIGIADVYVQSALWLRTTDWSGEFYYTHEVPTTGGIIPDATLILTKGGTSGLRFFEVDNGTETIIGNGAYSLAKKLGLYASYYDSNAYARDFAPHGTFQGFRVCLITTSGRVRHVQHLLHREQHDFVLVTSFDQLKQGFGKAIWTTSENETVDLLGRRRELVGEIVREIVVPESPSTATDNPRAVNELATTRRSETIVTGQGAANEEDAQ